MAVATSIRDGVGIIMLNRPEKRNAFNKDMFVEVRSAVNDLCSRVTGLILTGNKYFSAGLDLVEVYNFTSVEQARQYFNELISMINSFVKCEKPVVALVNDSAYGFSVELLYFMDRVISLRSIQFSLPGIKYGIVPVTPAFAPYLGIRARAFIDPGFSMTAQDAYRTNGKPRPLGRGKSLKTSYYSSLRCPLPVNFLGMRSGGRLPPQYRERASKKLNTIIREPL